MALGLVATLAIGAPTAAAQAAPSCWIPPVDGIVVDPYRPPACPYCPGNRGIEYRVEPRTPVRVAASGTVTFAGSVAGTRYVVVALPNGWRLTYGGLDTTRHRRGDRVVAGAVLGIADGRVHFGLRIGDAYADPTPHLGRWRGVPRLVPLVDRPRPAPPARLTCAAERASSLLR